MASDRTHSQQTLAHKRRGRKLGVKTVSAVVEQQRQAWLRRVTQEKGKNIQLCQLLRVPDSFVSHLTAGRRTFTDSIVERIEQVMQLPKGTIDAGLVVACETDADSASLTVSHIAPASCSLEPGLKVALQSLLSQALAQGKVSNTDAVRLINELVTLSA